MKKFLHHLTILGFNIEKKPFDDVRVRQAITMLINLDEVLRRRLRRFWSNS